MKKYYVSYRSVKNHIRYIKEIHYNKEDAFSGKRVWEKYPEVYDEVKVLIELKNYDLPKWSSVIDDEEYKKQTVREFLDEKIKEQKGDGIEPLKEPQLYYGLQYYKKQLEGEEDGD